MNAISPKRICRTLQISLLSGCLLQGQQALPSASDAAWAHAADLINSAHIRRARDVLADLLSKDPSYFFAYSTYWDIIARSDNEQARRLQAAHDLTFLESVPHEQRTEDFYVAYEYALRLTGQSDRAKLAHEECIEQFPNGRAAQSEILDAARAETDPVKSVAMLRDYIRRFPDNVSWTEVAAHEIFFTMTRHANRFASADILAAAGDWERHEAAYLHTFGQPARYLLCLEFIADGITPYDPEKALEYCQKGEAFAEAQWPETPEIADNARRDFWPILLRDYVALKRWPAALRLGATLEALFDAHTFLSTPGSAPEQAEARAAYSVALEATGDTEAARRQLGLASALDASRETALDEFNKRHPVAAPILATLRSDWSKAALALKNGNEEEMKRKLLASEENRAAAPLGLRDLAGRPVTLDQFRGKPLILSFWATWCGFCRFELADLTKFHAAHPDSVAVLAVSTDRDKDAVGPFASKLGVKLPIAISDGTNEDAYSTESIPQLYMLDSNGRIRFHVAGYDQDGLFLKRITWMLDALEPASATAAR